MALGIQNAEIRMMEESIPEKFARFLTNPYVIPILLVIAGIGIVIELFSPGFGFPGLVGFTALGLFFYGHLVAGLTGYESIALFVIGIILVLLEFFLPGGIIGFIGFGSIIGSLFMAAQDPVHMTVSLLVAIAASILVFILFVKVFGKSMKFFKKLILTDATTTEKGYVSHKNRVELLGTVGMALTDLRPSGTAVIDDERIDVVSEGGFILKGSSIKIVKVEGSRIVVREIPKIKEGKEENAGD